MNSPSSPLIRATAPMLASLDLAGSAWGMHELYVTDPHGNLLKFGEPL